MAIIKSMCTNCMGKGHINHYDHIANGVCFKCLGTGYIEIDEEKQKKAEARALKRAQKTKEKQEVNKQDQFNKYIEKRHLEALKMNEDYDKRKLSQQSNTESVTDALQSFFDWIDE